MRPEIEAIEPTQAHDVDGKYTYHVPTRLEFIRKVGSGAYGTVCSFKDTETGDLYAVKKIQSAFDDLVDAKRILREVKLLRQLKHDNIISIFDMYPPPNADFEDIYIVTDLMETDLHRVIYSKQQLTDEHFQYFIYQLLRGLKYLHSANVLHRDLKPSNILVNKNCDLKICDFGLARGFKKEGEEDNNLTDYVVTRWYRAPEVVLLASEYTKAIDMWSVGCILCELIGRKALFTGKDHLDQIKKIVDILGYPVEEDLHWLPKDGPARRFLQKCPQATGKAWHELYPRANQTSLGLVNLMLRFDPCSRIDVQEALEHPYFEGLHTPEDEPIAEHPVEWAFDDFVPNKRLMQNYIYLECASFREIIMDRDASVLVDRGIKELLDDQRAKGLFWTQPPR
jgi:mitogen-activated protein kinase 1/3